MWLTRHSFDLPGSSVPLEAFQIATQLGRALKPDFAILFQGLIDDALQLHGQVRIKAHRRCWRRIENGFEYNSRSIAAKRELSSGHLVQHSTEREQVGASIEFLPSHLLRR